MALVFCDNCGHRVSTTAPRCPSCGVPGPAAQVARQPSTGSPVPAANVCGTCGAKSYSTAAGYCTKCGTSRAPSGTTGRRRRGKRLALGFVGIALAASAVVLLFIHLRNSVSAPTRVFRPSSEAAVLLTSGPHKGEVLIGGSLLYNPASNALAIHPAMNADPRYATTTLLADGTVLIAGGLGKPEARTPNDGITIAAVAESKLFSPATSSFLPVGNMADARLLHTATLLPDGRVLIAGGFAKAAFGREHVNFAPLASSELYDPQRKSFSAGPRMTAPRFDAIAISLHTGKVLIIGGADSLGDAIASTEIYDPTTNAFERGPNLIAARAWTAASELTDGRIVILGGCSRYLMRGCEGSLASTEFYDPRENIFTRGPSMNGPLGGAAATALASGKVLIVGGVVQTGSGNIASVFGPDSAATTEIFDPTTDTFAQGPTMNDSRTNATCGATAIRLNDNRVLLFGGGFGIEFYNPARNSFAPP